MDTLPWSFYSFLSFYYGTGKVMHNLKSPESSTNRPCQTLTLFIRSLFLYNEQNWHFVSLLVGSLLLYQELIILLGTELALCILTCWKLAPFIRSRTGIMYPHMLEACSFYQELAPFTWSVLLFLGACTFIRNLLLYQEQNWHYVSSLVGSLLLL